MSAVSGTTIDGRLVLDDRVVDGRVRIEGESIAEVTLVDGPAGGAADRPTLPLRPFIAPGFVDVHVHGWGGHDAMDSRAALDGMARSLLRRGVTSFLPTAVTAPLGELAAFAERVRTWQPDAPTDGAQPLGFNLEGPFLAAARRGAHDPAYLEQPARVPHAASELVAGLRLITIAPELPGAIDLIHWLRERGVTISLGHSAASFEEARAGYDAGATSTTHLFNAMSGVDHRAPGLAVAALLDDRVYVELIADGIHVDRALWPLITRLKPVDRIVAVSDALSMAGTGDWRGRIGGLDVEVVGERVTLAGASTLAGSVIGLDTSVRHLVGAGVPLPAASATASRNPLAMIGIVDRGRIAVGQRADLVELDADLRVQRVMRAGSWHPAAAS